RGGAGGDRERGLGGAAGGLERLVRAGRARGRRDHGVGAAGGVVAERVLQRRGDVAAIHTGRARRGAGEHDVISGSSVDGEGVGARVGEGAVVGEGDRPAAGLLVVVLEAHHRAAGG